jgi:hypothetical protein
LHGREEEFVLRMRVRDAAAVHKAECRVRCRTHLLR